MAVGTTPRAPATGRLRSPPMSLRPHLRYQRSSLGGRRFRATYFSNSSKRRSPSYCRGRKHSSFRTQASYLGNCCGTYRRTLPSSGSASSDSSLRSCYEASSPSCRPSFPTRVLRKSKRDSILGQRILRSNRYLSSCERTYESAYEYTR